MAPLGGLFGPPSREDFAKKIMRAFKSAGYPGELRFDAEDFSIAPSGNEGARMHLGNCYQEYCAAKPAERSGILDRYIRIAMAPIPEPPKTWEEARPQLLPRVYDRFYIEAIRLRSLLGGEPLPEQPFRPIAGHLVVALALDSPETIMSVDGRMLESWGVDFDSALKAARDNLWKISNEDFRNVAAGLYQSPWGDSHDAARLFLHDLVWQLKVDGKHVAMVPNRDTLLVTGSECEEGLSRMAKLADELMQGPRPMSGIPVVLEGIAWEPFIPPADHPASDEFALLRMQTIASDYHQQKQFLDAIREKTGEGPYPAKFEAAQDPQGRLFAFATVGDGVDTLLPEVDMIAFGNMGEGGKPRIAATANWRRALDTLPALFEPSDNYPPRWRVRRFPTPEELASLGPNSGPF